MAENGNSTPRARGIGVGHNLQRRSFSEFFWLTLQPIPQMSSQKNGSPEVPTCLTALHPGNATDLARMTKRQQRNKVMKSLRQGRASEMSSGCSSVPNHDSSVVHLSDIITPTQNLMPAATATWKALCHPLISVHLWAPFSHVMLCCLHHQAAELSNKRTTPSESNDQAFTDRIPAAQGWNCRCFCVSRQVRSAMCASTFSLPNNTFSDLWLVGSRIVHSG